MSLSTVSIFKHIDAPENTIKVQGEKLELLVVVFSVNVRRCWA